MDPELTNSLKDVAAKLAAYLEKQTQPDANTSLADRMDGVFKTFSRIGIALLSGAALIALVILVFNAVNSHSIIMEEFEVPKALADRGWTGQAVAKSLRDALRTYHTETRREHKDDLNLPDDASDLLKTEIPHTGISIGQLSNFLHRHLGHDIHITGELVQLPGNDLLLIVRGDGITAHPLVFKEADFISKTIDTDAAGYIYGAVEPAAYATRLLQRFRLVDGMEFLAKNYPLAPAKARPQLATLWAKFEAYSGNFERAVQLDQLALTLDQYYWPAWEELAQDRRLLEGPESEWATFQAMHKAARHAPFTRQPRLIDFRLEYNLLHDASGEIQALLQDRSTTYTGTEGTSAWFGLAMAELSRHGADAARRYMTEADPDDPELEGHLTDVSAGLHPQTDTAAILRAREAADKFNERNEAYRNMIPDGACGLAISYAQLGQRDQALQTLDRVQNQNPQVGCAGNAGVALDLLGDHAAADKAFADAIARMPDLPDAYEQRGEVLYRRHNWAGAAADFAKAHEKSPHWADPLKYWGDALLQQGRRDEARVKYDAALACAPEWPDLLAARKSLETAQPATNPRPP